MFRWSAPGVHAQHPYFTSPAVTADDRWLLTMQESEGRVGLWVTDRRNKSCVPLHEPDRRMYAYVYGDGDRSGGFSKSSVSLDAGRGRVYWQQGQELFAAELGEGAPPPRSCARLPEGWVSAYNHVSDDGRYVVIPLTHPDAFYDGMSQEDHMKEVPPKLINHGLCSRIYLLDVQSGELRCLAEVPLFVTHAQCDPSGSGRILFNSEGSYWMTGEAHKRIWVLEANGEMHPLFDQAPDTECSHENFSPDGSMVIYHGHRRDWSSFVSGRTLDGDVCWEIDTPDFHPWHAITTPDLPGFTIDVADGRILLGRLVAGQLHLRELCRHASSMSHQDVHAHPVMTPDGKGVVFTSDVSGCAGVYEVRLA